MLIIQSAKCCKFLFGHYFILFYIILWACSVFSMQSESTAHYLPITYLHVLLTWEPTALLPQHANQWMRYLAQTLADVRDDLMLIDAVLWSSPSAEGPEGGIVGCKEWGMGWNEREKPVGWGLDELILTLYCQLMVGLFNWSWMDSKGQCWDAHTLYCSR